MPYLSHSIPFYVIYNKAILIFLKLQQLSLMLDPYMLS